mmetsp:Transcript_19791/g.35807  ORF Transcript_19791/g.35807 Transcript_19791/m.35807 type:complete len:397 (-) Transcript_19791:152-1342(-)|eukprot:CAMPEP_0201937616 /NCGR_PEP_ID=MMETSP0903-20130614/39829_1 /ASSEMBLY_ACC=CAM_ASM_000552 /TAXON_ID=420261 /ORGANISM="Thalassiosira antarctica, Strain CCMP982" /LENGTH=396 /DNA_ID=CAMNT_0048478647 /DNA_START=222 /DNA_END=1412 /DNA_ORIENTATION=+
MTSGSSSYHECDHCGAKESDEKRLSKCTGCNKVLYCSTHCQKTAWKSHEKRCRRASNKADTLELDDEKLNNFDSILGYASKYMKNLKHVKLRINDDHENKKRTILTASILQSFLKSTQGQLETLQWSMDDFCFHCGKEKTNEGQIWTELHGLKVLRMNFPVFSNSNDLCKVIKQQQASVMSLALSSLVMGRDIKTWSRNDCRALARAISHCKNLVRLELNENFLRDSDLEIMVPRLPNLRILLLSGETGPGGHLTDKSCKVISRMCHNLQELDIGYQRKITASGVKRICKSCPYLRMIQTSATLQPKEVEGLLCMAPKLFFMGTETCFDEAFYLKMAEATGGRTVFRAFGICNVFDVEALSSEVQNEYRNSQYLLHLVMHDLADPKIINEWENMFG